jgi:ferritin
MINKVVQDAINDQINKELYSAYLYLSMAAHFEAATLPGFAKWMRIQAQEEQGHALRFFDYLNDRSGRVLLKPIAGPQTEWKTPFEVFNQVLEHEQQVTASIHKLYEVALKDNDYATQVMLQWFINEQVEEEKSASQIIEQLKRIDAHESALLILDHELGERGE